MNIMLPFEFIVGVIEAAAWPVTALLIVYMFRNSMKSLFLLVDKFQYKEITINFRKIAKDTLDSIQTEKDEDSESVAQMKHIYDPRSVVIDAWRNLEEAAIAKFHELTPKRSVADLGPDRALGYFEYMGVLIPRTKQALSELRKLRNQVTCLPQSAISIDGAEIYARAAAIIRRQIEALSALPEMKLNRLTLLILEYNQILDTGKYNHITIKDIHREIKQGTVLRYISNIAGSDADFSIYLDVHDELGFEAQYAKHLQSIYGGYAGQERRKWGIQNLGLCLLIAWTNEIIQRGSGWQPNEEVM